MTVLVSARREEARRCVICNDERLVWRQSGHFHNPSTVGRKGNLLQRRLAGLYFAASAHKRPIEQLLTFKVVKIYPHPVAFHFDPSSPTGR